MKAMLTGFRCCSFKMFSNGERSAIADGEVEEEDTRATSKPQKREKELESLREGVTRCLV